MSWLAHDPERFTLEAGEAQRPVAPIRGKVSAAQQGG
jgi:hypothetical protein